MPTYRVTDPTTGRTVKLTGDAPPTEQELEDVFKGLGVSAAPEATAAQAPAAAAPPSSPLADTAVDVGKGLAKSAVEAVWSPATLLANVTDWMAKKAGAPGVMQHLPDAQPEHTDGLVGQAAGLVSRVASDPEALSASNNAQLAGKIGGFAAQVAGPGLVSKLGKLSARPAATVAKTVDPMAPRLVKAPPKVSTEQELIKALDELRAPKQPMKVDAAAPTRITPGGRPSTSLENPTPRTGPKFDAPTSATTSAKPAIRVDATAPAASQIVKQTDDLLSAGTSPAEVVEAIEASAKQTVPQMVADMRRMYGAERAGKQIYGSSLPTKEAADAVRRIAPGPSRHPLLAELDGLDRDFSRRIADPRGFGGTALTSGLGGAAIGGAAGALVGEEDDDRVVNALMGAGLGAVGVPLIAAAALRHPGAAKAAQNTLYTFALSNPATLAKAYLGAIGGTVSAVAEKSLTDPGAAARIATTFMQKGVPTFLKALQKPAAAAGAVEDAPGLVQRIYGAMDAAARTAMAAGGIGGDDAARYTLSGVPTTERGKSVLAFFNRHFEAKLIGSMFPRVGIQILERGMERTPLGPFLPGLNPGATAAEKGVRAGLGTAAGLASYAYADQIPEWARPYVAAAAGPYALGFSSGAGAGDAEDSEGMLGAVVGQVGKNMPLPQYGPTEALNHHLSGSSLVPAAVGAYAAAKDPYERDTRGSMFNRTRAKIPGLREKLPVKGRDVNIAGEPIVDRSTPLSRVIKPAPSKNKPMTNIPEAVSAELKRLDVRINAPDFDQTKKLGGKDVKLSPEQAERAQKERRQYLVPAITKLLDSPAYKAASDESKKKRLERTISQAEERGAAAARASLSKILRTANATR